MARLIEHNLNGPYEIPPSEKSAWICMCGLSKNYPFCDGAHKHAKQQETEGKQYTYNAETAEVIDTPIPTRAV